MTDHLTSVTALIDKSKAIHDAATRGKWRTDSPHSSLILGPDGEQYLAEALGSNPIQASANATAIAHAHNLHAALLEVARAATSHRQWLASMSREDPNSEVLTRARALFDHILQPLDTFAQSDASR